MQDSYGATPLCRCGAATSPPLPQTPFCEWTSLRSCPPARCSCSSLGEHCCASRCLAARGLSTPQHAPGLPFHATDFSSSSPEIPPLRTDRRRYRAHARSTDILRPAFLLYLDPSRSYELALKLSERSALSRRARSWAGPLRLPSAYSTRVLATSANHLGAILVDHWPPRSGNPGSGSRR